MVGVRSLRGSWVRLFKHRVIREKGYLPMALHWARGGNEGRIFLYVVPKVCLLFRIRGKNKDGQSDWLFHSSRIVCYIEFLKIEQIDVFKSSSLIQCISPQCHYFTLCHSSLFTLLPKIQTPAAPAAKKLGYLKSLTAWANTAASVVSLSQRTGTYRPPSSTPHRNCRIRHRCRCRCCCRSRCPPR